MSAHPPIGVVFNPAKGDRDRLEHALASAPDGTVVSWHETTVKDPGRSACRDAIAAGAELVISAGGDGTVRAVAEELADSGAQVDLAIVPFGTGNLLARNLGVPLTGPAAAIRHALRAQPRVVDVGWAELESAGGPARYAFTVMAGFGIDAHMITETDEDLKKRAGWLAYVESLGRAVSASEVIGFTARIDGQEAREARAHTLIVGNCGTLQGGIALLPDADFGDGRLDLVAVDADGVVGWLDAFRNLVWNSGIGRFLPGEARNSESVSYGSFESLDLELSEPRHFEVDGDEVGEVSRVRLTVQPGALRVR
ncbi:diacylglycerol/lipid kinase family protein [Microbacterium excoecariae]|uniref:diacylglycerol/lipid kinase family protein n=1 Tax=Microbacterium excoecariae TaxID=2715210 RepID=UPI001409FBEF|nr:diacylglycerol kinase family protein [Microbacterium excoecariae]NHI17241.1 diacylglycerol kinase [Microbacterium excoecariae]